MSSPRAAARSHYLWSLVEPAELDDTLILAEGEGVRVTTVEGDGYLDLMSTVSRASCLGYGEERIARAVYEQLGSGCTTAAPRTRRRTSRSSWPTGSPELAPAT